MAFLAWLAPLSLKLPAPRLCTALAGAGEGLLEGGPDSLGTAGLSGGRVDFGWRKSRLSLAWVLGRGLAVQAESRVTTCSSGSIWELIWG